MDKKVFPIFILIATITLLTACNQVDMEGMILEVVSEEEYLFSSEMTPDEYEEVHDLAWDELMEESVPLITITYSGSETFEEGDYVNVWIDGDVLTSYPGQAKASKIQLKEK